MNNNNKQFFWEVKEFFNKKPILEQKNEKKDILKTIKEVVSSNMNSQVFDTKSAKQNIINSSKDIKTTTNYLLNNYNSISAKQTPNSIGKAPNKVSNLFNLYEMMGPNTPSSTGNVGRPRNMQANPDSASAEMVNVNPPPSSVSGYISRTRPIVAGTNASTEDQTQSPLTQDQKDLKQTVDASGNPITAVDPSANSAEESKEEKLERQKNSLLDAASRGGPGFGKVRDPMRASSNEILYGHSVKAYR